VPNKRPGADTARSALERRALLATRALVDRMRRLYRELEQLTGAPIAAHRVLVCLAEEPGITASRLATAVDMRRPALSQVLKGLVERGWIKRVRSDDDQRSVRVYLTDVGRQVHAATAGRAVGTLQRAVGQLSDDQLGGIADGIEGVLGNLPIPTDEVTRATGLRPRSAAGLHLGLTRRLPPRARAKPLSPPAARSERDR
jgi:DNA-binding MarR family transcriptional regulator